MKIPSALLTLFNFKTDPKEALIKKQPQEKQDALRSVLDGNSEFRDHTEFQNTRAVLHVTHKDNTAAQTVVDEYLDVNISNLPDEAQYVGPEFMRGLWPVYSIELTGNPETFQVSKQRFNVTLKDGTQQHLGL